MNIEITGFAALAIFAFATLCMTFPIKISATMIGAPEPTLIKSFIAPVLAAIITFLLGKVFPATLLLSPFILLLVFKKVFDISFAGSFGLTALTCALYVILYKLFMSGISIS
ncbi:hypothetical protein [Colwellia sp. Bg11-28]|uniref:hypothetical protein n=1 Tax=Colwellia sp. Bg11-28 TaxID=2058305 RepID=UPI000CAFCBC6|nr:hypothetical protein [Colwellia sp. Bg11-28]PKH89002.1 hypothetical protein CXF79_03720 [Colwellia sp. Bg11-28]